MERTKTLIWPVALGAALFAIFRAGFVNWDTAYALVWGNEVASGRRPDFEDAALVPTTHPLADLLGLVLAGFGDAAEGIVVALGFLALGAVGYLVYRIAATWFGPAAGVAAAAIVLTREPILSSGVRAYVDLPYLALVLGALAVEVRRPRAGAPVLVLLLFAGLLRPEAWLFSFAYLGWLALPWLRAGRGAGREEAAPAEAAGEKKGSVPFLSDSVAYWEARRARQSASVVPLGEVRRRITRLLPLALAGPVLWSLVDLVSTGDPLASLTGTRDNVETLGRATGLDGLFSAGPRRLGEILREPALVAAALGAALGLAWRRRPTLAALGAAVLALAAFAILALAGLPVITRYLLLEAALLCLLAGAAAGGWLLVRGAPRWAWLGAAVAVLGLFAALGPAQAERLSDLRDAIEEQDRIHDDLHDLARDDAFPIECAPITVPNSRVVPLLALWLDRPPDDLVTPGRGRQPARGIVVLPARPSVARAFALDKRDPGASRLRRPRGFALQGANRSWRVYARC